MRSERERDAFLDIVDNVDAARSFSAGMTFDAFVSDKRTVYAVIRCLEIISEASRHIRSETQARHPHIPWRAIADAGTIYRHSYHRVELDLVRPTVEERLGDILAVCRAEPASPPRS